MRAESFRSSGEETKNAAEVACCEVSVHGYRFEDQVPSVGLTRNEQTPKCRPMFVGGNSVFYKGLFYSME